MANITTVLEDGLAQIREGASEIDLAGVSELDSSLLAAILAWIREARLSHKKVQFVSLPKGLQTLAQLYGVEHLLPVNAGP